MVLVDTSAWVEFFRATGSAVHHRVRGDLAGSAPLATTDVVVVDRTCRAQGVTIRRLTDCLIGTVAIRTGVPLLHADHDFDLIARCSGLRIETP